MKQLFFSIIFGLMVNAGFSAAKPVSILKAEDKRYSEVFVAANVYSNNPPNEISITACGRTGNFIFSDEFTLVQIVHILLAIRDEFCHIGTCAES